MDLPRTPTVTTTNTGYLQIRPYPLTELDIRRIAREEWEYMEKLKDSADRLGRRR
jgi:hypothetical protein